MDPETLIPILNTLYTVGENGTIKINIYIIFRRQKDHNFVRQSIGCLRNLTKMLIREEACTSKINVLVKWTKHVKNRKWY